MSKGSEPGKITERRQLSYEQAFENLRTLSIIYLVFMDVQLGERA